MKKIKLIILLLPLLLLATISFAQQGKWTVEFSSGVRIETYESHNHEFGYPMTFRPTFPQIEVNFWYGIKDYFFLESGLSYVEYNSNWQCGYEIGYPKWKRAFISKHKLYSALQIPLRARFSVPLGKSDFHFLSSTGIVLQFTLQRSVPNGWFPENDPYKDFSGEINMGWKTSYCLIAYSPMREINILLNTKIGFMYQFNFGLGISVFGEYYKGTRTMVMIDAIYNEKLSNESDYYPERVSNYETKGDCWNAGIGISYTFKNTRKEKN